MADKDDMHIDFSMSREQQILRVSNNLLDEIEEEVKSLNQSIDKTQSNIIDSESHNHLSAGKLKEKHLCAENPILGRHI